MQGTLNFINVSQSLVARILTERVPNFFPAEEREQGICIVQAIIGGDATKLPPEYKYLAEIVNNSYCGVDVKLWDFLLRDLYYLGKVDMVSLVTQETLSFFERAKIIMMGTEAHITYDYNDLNLIEGCFQARAELRMAVYQHADIRNIRREFRSLLEAADKWGFTVNNRRVMGSGAEFQHLDDSVMNHLDIFIEANNGCVSPEYLSLHQKYARFKTSISQLTNYSQLNKDLVEERRLLQRVPFFKDDGNIEQVEIKY